MATTIHRHPPIPRARSALSVASPQPQASRAPSGIKRPRSPGIAAEDQLHPGINKRAKAAPETPSQKHKRRHQQERESKEREFREKYSHAFPKWTFHFSEEIQNTDYVKVLEKRILQLGGAVDDFFSSQITHLIIRETESQTKTVTNVGNKENRTGLDGAKLRKSPSKPALLPPEAPEAYSRYNNLKTWDVRKLDSVLARCMEQPLILPTSGAIPSKLNPSVNSRSLTKLLQSEKIHGSTERDPTQKRHDFTYFARGSYFVLVEDMRQELATIAAQQYIPPRKGSQKPPWPVLYCHPQSRGPFIAFDEKEKRRWERQQRAEKEEKNEAQEEHRRREKLMQERISRERDAYRRNGQRGGDLRRSVSMNNLRRESLEADITVDLHGDGLDSACASGYLASGTGGYVAASGNSVGITSTTGTTSAAGYSLAKLPPNLQSLADAEVVTSRRVNRRHSTQRGDMGPPALPETRIGLLRKSKSTNTLKLPKRDEGSKPGYCESCRVKFDDFKLHIVSSRHRRFATNDANFAQLDYVLAKVRRKPVAEIEAERCSTTRGRQHVASDDICNDSYDDTDMPDVDLDDE